MGVGVATKSTLLHYHRVLHRTVLRKNGDKWEQGVARKSAFLRQLAKITWGHMGSVDKGVRNPGRR